MQPLVNATVYIVDDDAEVRDALAWLLRSRRLLSEGFGSAEAFAAILQTRPPQKDPACVLLDVRMPGMGGLNVQEELRRHGIDLPLIFVSGHADVPIVVRAFRAGAVDFIEKPYNEQLLLDSVQQALASRVQPPPAEAGRLAEVRACLDQLTPREREVLLPLVRGHTNREIAEQLAISVKTVDLYRSRVMKRMQAQTLPELVGMAIAAGLVDPLALRG